MGIYVNKANNVVEELLKVIPVSFFTSEEFQKDAEKRAIRNVGICVQQVLLYLVATCLHLIKKR